MSCKLQPDASHLQYIVACILFGEHGDETLDKVHDAINCLFGGPGQIAGLNYTVAIPVGGEDAGRGEQVRSAVAWWVDGHAVGDRQSPPLDQRLANGESLGPDAGG